MGDTPSTRSTLDSLLWGGSSTAPESPRRPRSSSTALTLRPTLPAGQAGPGAPRADSIEYVQRLDAPPKFEHGKLQRRDSWANAAKRLGVSGDVATQTQPVWEGAIDIEQIAALYRRGPYPRICEQQAMWTWGDFNFSISGLDPKQEELIKRRLEQTGFWTAQMRGDAWGSGFGVDPVHAVVSSDGRVGEDDPAKPLDSSKVTRVYNFIPLNPRRAVPILLDERREAQSYLQPLAYRVQPDSMASFTPAPYELHASRTLYHYGIIDDRVSGWLTYTGMWSGAPRPWADQLWGALRSLGALYRGIDRAALEAIVHVFTLLEDGVGRSADLDAGDGGVTPDLQAKMTAIADAMSASRKVVLQEGEDLKAVVADFKAIYDLMRAVYNRYAMESGYPLAWFNGEAPTGLSTDEGSWWMQVEKRIMARRRERAVPILRKAIPWFLAEQGIKIPRSAWRIELGPLRPKTPEQIAELREKLTRADAMLLDRGVITAAEIRGREEGGAYRAELVLEPRDEQRLSQEDTLAAIELALDRAGKQREALAESDLQREDAQALSRIRRDAEDLPASVREMRIKVPEYVSENAQRGKDLREKFGRGMPAGEDGSPATGALTAADLISGEVGPERILLMEDWMARHMAPEQLRGKKGAPGWADPEDPSAGWIALLGWGEDGSGEAKAWVEREAERIRKAVEEAKAKKQKRGDADFTGKACVMARLSPLGVERWQALRERVELITGPLEGYEPEDDGIQEAPHVTVLYLGAVAEDDLGEVQEAVVKAAGKLTPQTLALRGVKVLPPGPVSGEDRRPVVAEVGAWGLRALHEKLLRALAHLIKARQWPTYEQHVTLGFAQTPDGDTLAALAEMDVRAGSDLESEDENSSPSLGAIAEVIVTYGGEVIASAPLLGRKDAQEPEEGAQEPSKG